MFAKKLQKDFTKSGNAVFEKNRLYTSFAFNLPGRNCKEGLKEKELRSLATSCDFFPRLANSRPQF